MKNDIVLCDSVQAIVDGFPDNKRKIQDYILEAGHILFDSPLSSIISGANGVFQTFALMQGQKQYTKVVKYVTDLEKTRVEAKVRLREFDLKELQEKDRYNIQKEILTLYVDRNFQNAVDNITRDYQRTRKVLEQYRYEAVVAVSEYTKSTLAAIDKQTREIIRYEEMICAAYRNETALAKQRGMDRVDIANKVTEKIIQDPNAISDRKLELFLDFIDRLTKPFISFQDFVILEGMMGESK